MWYVTGTSIGANPNDCPVEAQGAGDHEGEAADENVKEKAPKRSTPGRVQASVSQGVTP